MEKDKSYFGFKSVSPEIKQTLVNRVFSDVFDKYDLMNDLMSVGVHRLWKEKLVNMIPRNASIILDMAAGTGDIAINYCKRNKDHEYKLVLCDINHAMLSQARKKLINHNFIDVSLIVGDATQLPFEDNKFDCYVVAFGIRNVNNIALALQQARRVLKDGGKFLCLELSPIEEKWYSMLYDFYSFNIIPMLGGLLTKKKDAYQYLVESIRMFPNKENFEQLLRDNGFSNTGFDSLTFGVAAIHYGYK